MLSKGSVAAGGSITGGDAHPQGQPGGPAAVWDADGQRRRETDGRIVGEELARLGWARSELERRRKGELQKVRIARQLRAETTVRLKWIAACLLMGTWTYVANPLYHCRP
jgi:hypothetical protein